MFNVSGPLDFVTYSLSKIKNFLYMIVLFTDKLNMLSEKLSNIGIIMKKPYSNTKSMYTLKVIDEIFFIHKNVSKFTDIVERIWFIHC